MPYYTDEGEELYPTPQLCMSCKKKDIPSEEILCTLTRFDQKPSEEFVCYSYESIAD